MTHKSSMKIAGKFKSVLRSIRQTFNEPDRFLKDISGVIHVGANAGSERKRYNTYNLNVLWIKPIPEVLLDSLQI